MIIQFLRTQCLLGRILLGEGSVLSAESNLERATKSLNRAIRAASSADAAALEDERREAMRLHEEAR